MPQHRLCGFRGKAYTAKYKQLYEDLKFNIEFDVYKVRAQIEKFSLNDFGALCMKY